MSASSAPRPDAGWRLEHSYAQLPERFHRATSPTPVGQPRLVVFNRPLAASLGLDSAFLARPEFAGIFAGNALPPGARPLAQAYAGHQFGNFTLLGDGRAILLGEQVTPNGARFDVQLKGAGPTAFSRRGDGRATLGPMLREYVISEAMHALGIPTTRSLAVATTGERVFRQGPLPGAVLTRVAASHLRVGTFEWAAAQRDETALAALTDYAIRRHDPDLAGTEHPPLAFLRAVIERQAALLARWILVGFVHGVMNTDNMAISGETIDYGPCAFLDAFDPATVFSSIDEQGRYAYGNQPGIARWNLARFAEALLPLLHANEKESIALATEALAAFAPSFQAHWLAGMRGKLGLFGEDPNDAALIDDLLGWMRSAQADFTNTFRALSQEASASAALPSDPAFLDWQSRWHSRLAAQPQSPAESLALRRASNPAVIPRNHKVEEALSAAVERDDFDALTRLMAVLARPYDHEADVPAYQTPPGPEGRFYQTFCGT